MPRKKIRPGIWLAHELALINAVKKYPILYKKDYRSKEDATEECWEVISAEVGVPKDQCVVNWMKLRKDYFGTIHSRRKCLQFHESPLSFLDCSIFDKIYKSASDSKKKNKNNYVAECDQDSLSDKEFMTDEELKNLIKPKKKRNISTLRSHPNRSLPQTSIPKSKVMIAGSHTTKTDEKNLPETVTEIKIEVPDIDDTDANESNPKRFKPSSDTPLEFEIPATTSVVKQEVEYNPTLTDLSVGLASKDAKTFYNEVASYITSKFSAKKQTDIQLRIYTLLTHIELEKLKAAKQ
ncbi:uncharacterized protein LOC114353869 [Ostrinia furnacalis]|uniref:uncharacterized protein LOC114353869 n=1 Tax=Ostrinia furnacalis TaxID=93504 RepID=UPI00103F87A2|nr:uncharacterized protein LOC114353869 [Ostrinia furnacalis]XP_028161800.1 uncharacterized protein LOC114353869 [Ostrinia furnacalis]